MSETNLLIIDPKEESNTYETEASSQTESKLSAKPVHDDFTSASEDDHNDEEHMADDASARVHSLQIRRKRPQSMPKQC
ncbi:hypothetical protein PSTG_18734 [Puccinia striiformis f. sp. tritici PST-78]|uniref:Uncharacterized protein n=1 Tax=Puccinia striiformis f. sp. tritici PST-78 TaxID=1165861 RepID=A0A0L0ULL3_9BASI|nr:hypothetical protein PSTG_18734 [Puccinia striiformis f. sp. tritici PST-78]